MLGSALSIKPILHMVDGTMTLKERHRTFSKAIAKLKDGALESAGGRAVTLGVQHCEAPELAAEVADDLRKRLKVLTSSIIVESRRPRLPRRTRCRRCCHRHPPRPDRGHSGN